MSRPVPSSRPNEGDEADAALVTPLGLAGSGRVRYAAAMHFHRQGRISDAALEVYRVCSARDGDDPARMLAERGLSPLLAGGPAPAGLIGALVDEVGLYLAGLDGPGLDEYEKLFGRSGVEVLLGWDEPRDLRMFDPHARVVFGKKLAAAPSTARFYLESEKRYFSALLDYVMVSPDLRARGPEWRIWHPFDDMACYQTPELREALLQASDHFPVSLDLPVGGPVA